MFDELIQYLKAHRHSGNPLIDDLCLIVDQVEAKVIADADAVVADAVKVVDPAVATPAAPGAAIVNGAPAEVTVTSSPAPAVVPPTAIPPLA